MTHPLHPFHTGRVETDAVVVGAAAVTSNLCSYCGAETIKNSRTAFQCHPCDFKLCSTCAQTEGYAHPAHVSHYLCWVNIVDEIWKCNGCNNSSRELKDTSCYFCSSCKFYLCRKCFEPKRYPLHQHELMKTDVRCVYHRSSGAWVCDCCGGSNGRGHYLPRHCNLCKYDLCEKCSQPHRSTLHLHDLYKADTELIYHKFAGGWRCDSCESLFRPSGNKYPYHCEICEFDLCDNCMMISDSKVPRRSTNMNQRGMGTTAAGFPLASPEEELNKVRGPAPAPLSEDTSCIICMTEPKNATIIHGATGHVCCCLGCAKKLERRGDPCPICREPIQLVIKQFLV